MIKLILLGLLFFYAGCNADNKNYPRIMIWAWERKEDLRFIDVNQAGVAYLALTFKIKQGKIIKRRRTNSLILAKNTYVIPVIRIEADNSLLLMPNKEIQLSILKEIALIVEKSRADRVQIDFEVLKSQRIFYKELLLELKKILSAKIKISITGLVSWCYEEDWSFDLPVEEIVPMSFDLGKDKKVFFKKMNSGEKFTNPLCRQSVGIALFSEIPNFYSRPRFYLFSNRAWNEADFKKILKRIDIDQGK